MDKPAATPEERSRPAPKTALAFCLGIMAVFTAGHARGADALDSDARLPPFSLRVGVYDMNLDTEVRVNGRGGLIGTRLNFEDDLNLDDNKETFDVGVRWRIAERHFLEAEYFQLKRSGFRQVDGEIRFGESVYPIASNIRSSFTTEVTRLGYGYRLVRRKNWGLALGVGLHVTRLRATLQEISIGNISLPLDDQEVAAVTAPLPVFGFAGARRLGENWALIVRGQSLSLKVDEYDGSIEHAAVQFEYDAKRRFGLGFGYDWFFVNVKSTDDLWIGNAKVAFHGPMLYATANF